MFESTKPSLFKETNGSYSNTVMGILIITLSFSLGLSVLGVLVIALDGSQEDTFDLPYIPDKSFEDIISQGSSDPKASEDGTREIMDEASLGVSDEPVPESGYVGRFDTEPGTLEIDWTRTYLPEGPLPLCIDNDYLANYYMTVVSVGGYSPKWGAIYLNQLKGDVCFEGVVFAHFEEVILDDCPCTVEYLVTFFVCEPICLDSNHLPQGFDQDVTLGKEVDVCFASQWEGCHLDTQKFMVILAHKAMSQNPKLPIN
ncbi:MAG: hypothetical protein ACFE9R_15540 [Candidatus Hermodarchaeota archaeon]